MGVFIFCFVGRCGFVLLLKSGCPFDVWPLLCTNADVHDAGFYAPIAHTQGILRANLRWGKTTYYFAIKLAHHA